MKVMDLWGQPTEVDQPTKLVKSEFMLDKYGATPGHVCKDCGLLDVTGLSRRYYKCTVYGSTSGPGTDWRLKWPACGLWAEELNWNRLKHQGRGPHN